MGSLKRKNASLGASAASSKRPTREDASGGAVANGYTGRRAASAQTSNSSAAAASAATMPLPAAAPEPLCNGVFAEAKANKDSHPPISASSLPDMTSVPLKTLKISENEAECSTDSQEQDAETAIVLPERSHSNNLGPLTPNHAGWFCWNSIHPLERRGLPEFFNSKSKLKTPTLYMEFRNLLMRKYLENPNRVFTLADVSQVVDQKGGNLEAAKRIFEFLNHWGLLNSRALQHAEAEKPTKPKAEVVETNFGRQSQWSLTSSLYHFDNPLAFYSSRNSTKVERLVPNTVLTETPESDLQGGEQGMPVEYHCNSCSADCSKKRFHCQKQADFDLCPECYNDGKFSFGITSTDFILMEAVTDTNDNGGWSDQETLLLLEALEMFGDNFSEIAEHVGTKTKAQCILHFIRLPIEDPFLEAAESNTNATTQPMIDSVRSVTASQGVDQQDTIRAPSQAPLHVQVQQEDSISVSGNAHRVDQPATDDKSSSATNAIMVAAEAAGLFASDKYLAFSDCGNPVMTLVAFLTALVAPDAVATSAQAALKVLADHASALQLADKNSFHLELETPSMDACTELDVNRESEEDVQTRPQSDDAQEMADVGGELSDKCNDQGITSNDSPEDLIKGSSIERVRNAATTALAAAAVKASFLADQEEWEILHLAGIVVDTQTKKIDTKLKLFKELDTALEKEHNLLERSRQRLFAEQSQIAATRVVQPSASGHYANLSAGMAGGVRPHSMPRLPTGFVSVPPSSAGPFPGPSDYMMRAPPIPPQGINMPPMRPVYYNNVSAIPATTTTTTTNNNSNNNYNAQF